MATLVGSFAKPTGTGGETHDITGLTNNAPPKFIQLWSSGLTTSGSFDTNANIKTSIGFTNGTTHQSVGVYAQDNVATEDSYRAHRASPLFGVTAAGTIEWEITSITFNAGGAHLVFGTNNATAVLINYEIIYGQDLTNVSVGSFSMPSTTGNFTIATGLSYVPSCARFITVGIPASTLPQGTDHAPLTFGTVVSTSQKGGALMMIRDNPPTVSYCLRMINNDGCIVISDTTTQTRAYSVDFVSFNTVGNGVTLNATTVSGANPGAIVSYALFGGGSWNIGTLNTSAPDVTGLGYQPDGLVLISAGIAGENVLATQSSFSIGAAGGGSQRCISIFGHHGQTTTALATRQDSSFTNILTPNTPVADATIQFNSFTASGFDLTSSNTRPFIYLTYNTGVAPSAAGGAVASARYYYKGMNS